MLEPVHATRRTILHVRMSGLLGALDGGGPDGACGAPRNGRGRRRGAAARALEAMLAPFSPVAAFAGDHAALVELRRCAAFSGAQRAGLRIRRAVAGPDAERCAIGIGPNRLIACMASRLAGGGGIVELDGRSFRERFRSAPVERLPGVRTEPAVRLRRLGVYTIGQLAAADPGRLVAALGVEGERLQRRARGVDDAPILGVAPPKAFGGVGQPRRTGARLAARPSPAFARLLRAG
jgi:nucleotidyltransferase/DNA polymerase involved in DNA repair